MWKWVSTDRNLIFVRKTRCLCIILYSYLVYVYSVAKICQWRINAKQVWHNHSWEKKYLHIGDKNNQLDYSQKCSVENITLYTVLRFSWKKYYYGTKIKQILIAGQSNINFVLSRPAVGVFCPVRRFSLIRPVPSRPVLNHKFSVPSRPGTGRDGINRLSRRSLLYSIQL